MAKFEIKTSFKLSIRNVLVIGGEIIEGTIRVGDHIWFSDGKQDYERKLMGVEAIDYKIGQSGFKSYIGLLINDNIEGIDPEDITKKEVPIISQ